MHFWCMDWTNCGISARSISAAIPRRTSCPNLSGTSLAAIQNKQSILFTWTNILIISFSLQFLDPIWITNTIGTHDHSYLQGSTWKYPIVEIWYTLLIYIALTLSERLDSEVNVANSCPSFDTSHNYVVDFTRKFDHFRWLISPTQGRWTTSLVDPSLPNFLPDFPITCDHWLMSLLFPGFHRRSPDYLRQA